MTVPASRVRRAALVLLGGASLLSATAALAQPRYPSGAVVQPLPDAGRGAELRGHLRTLADNPRSLAALIGAGRAAVALGDYQAALTFFTRALGVAPRDARALAGMGSVLIHMEQAQDSLRYFAEAAGAGAPAGEIAGDRGLAYDAVGDQGRAQADYSLSLRSREDPEVRRRLALSLAISGQRDPALRVIADQLARRDRAALRVQAFVLALTGDAAGAAQAARSAMPGAAGALTPFLARLPSLTPSQRAMAVHFGRFPTGGAPIQVAAAPPPPPPPRPASPPPAARTETRQTAQQQPRPQARSPQPDRQPARIAERPRGTAARGPLSEQVRQRQQPRPPQPRQPAPAARTEPPVQQAPVATTEVSSSAVAGAGSSQPIEPSAQAAPQAQQREARPGFDEIAALVSRLPGEERTPPPRPDPAPPPPQETRPVQRAERPAASSSTPRTERPAASPQRERAAAAAPAPQRRPVQQPVREAHPSRHWVQVAGGADRSALPQTFARLRGQAPALFRDRAAYATVLRATNRLLVGPFPSVDAAQDFVNQLARQNLTAFTWTSPAGQEVERLPPR